MGRTSEAIIPGIIALDASYFKFVRKEPDDRGHVIMPNVNQHHVAQDRSREALFALATGKTVFVLSRDRWGREFATNISRRLQREKKAEVEVFNSKHLPGRGQFEYGIALKPVTQI